LKASQFKSGKKAKGKKAASETQARRSCDVQ
jgi:hypothetical protein